jgi:hypothetical protein
VNQQVDQPREGKDKSEIEEQLDGVGCEVFGLFRQDQSAHSPTLLRGATSALEHAVVVALP